MEKEIIKVTLKIKQDLSVLENLKSVIFDETTNLFSYLNSKDPELATKWKTIAKKCEDSRQNIIKNLKNNIVYIFIKRIYIKKHSFSWMLNNLFSTLFCNFFNYFFNCVIRSVLINQSFFSISK